MREASGGVDSEYRAEPLDPRLNLAPCSTPLAATLNAPLQPNARRAVVRVACGSPQPWKVYVSVHLRRLIDVAVAARPLAPGEVLRPDDFVMRRRALADLPPDVLPAMRSIAGQELRQALLPGDVVRRHQLRRPVVLARGQLVAIVSEVPGVSVRMRGVAQSAGTAGAIIAVKNLSSGRLVQARVLDADRVAALGITR
ncbi:MAG: flagellar basal body P-ring formation chaperone FlgA [Pseudomonadota bacterium]